MEPKKPRTIAHAALAVALGTLLVAGGALAGCASLREEQASCRLDTNDPSQLTCDGGEYVILADTVADNALGRRRGALLTLVAFDDEGREVARMDTLAGLANLAALADRAPEAVGTASFAGVFERRGSERDLVVQVDGRNHLAVPDGEAPEGAAVFAFASEPVGANAADGFTIDHANARRLVNGEATYEITDEIVNEGRIRTLLDPIPKSVTFDAETLRPLSGNELLIDWNGDGGQRRETRIYESTWSLDDIPSEEAVAVKEGGAFHLAKRV